MTPRTLHWGCLFSPDDITLSALVRTEGSGSVFRYDEGGPTCLISVTSGPSDRGTRLRRYDTLISTGTSLWCIFSGVLWPTPPSLRLGMVDGREGRSRRWTDVDVLSWVRSLRVGPGRDWGLVSFWLSIFPLTTTNVGDIEVHWRMCCYLLVLSRVAYMI